jgi:hypothetical protein
MTSSDWWCRAEALNGTAMAAATAMARILGGVLVFIFSSFGVSLSLAKVVGGAAKVTAAIVL